MEIHSAFKDLLYGLLSHLLLHVSVKACNITRYSQWHSDLLQACTHAGFWQMSQKTPEKGLPVAQSHYWHLKHP